MFPYTPTRGGGIIRNPMALCNGRGWRLPPESGGGISGIRNKMLNFKNK